MRRGDEGAGGVPQDGHDDHDAEPQQQRDRGRGGGCAGGHKLKANTTLTALELNNNSVDYDGTVALAEALAENTSLETFSISGNYVGVWAPRRWPTVW